MTDSFFSSLKIFELSTSKLVKVISDSFAVIWEKKLDSVPSNTESSMVTVDESLKYIYASEFLDSKFVKEIVDEDLEATKYFV